MKKLFSEKFSLAKLICLALSAAMCFGLAGCGDNGEKDNESSKPLGVVTDDVESEVLEASKVANKKYGGKTFKMLFNYAPGEITERRIRAFNKAHDANIEIVVEAGQRYANLLATAVAGGTPYDIVAINGNYFPNLATQDLLEPLNDYYTDVDFYNSAKPKNGGITKEYVDAFSYKGKAYAVGSAKSVYSLMFIYNKKLFNDNGLEDPWTLYKEGKWTWKKFMEMGQQVTDVTNGVSFTQFGDVNVWLNINCVPTVTVKDGKYNSEATSQKMIYAMQAYQQLYLGKNPICLNNTRINDGTNFGIFAASNAFSTYATTAKNSSAFGNSAANLGAVPVPTTNLNDTGKYPLHASVGYAVTKGAADPSVAVCYALFESRLTDVETGDELQLNPEITQELIDRFNENPYVVTPGFLNSDGKTLGEYYRDEIGKPIFEGADVTMMMNSKKSVIDKIIADTVS